MNSLSVLKVGNLKVEEKTTYKKVKLELDSNHHRVPVKYPFKPTISRFY